MAKNMSVVLRQLLAGRGWVDIERAMRDFSAKVAPEHAARRQEDYLKSRDKAGLTIQRTYTLSEKIQLGKNRVWNTCYANLVKLGELERDDSGETSVIRLTELGELRAVKGPKAKLNGTTGASPLQSISIDILPPHWQEEVSPTEVEPGEPPVDDTGEVSQNDDDHISAEETRFKLRNGLWRWKFYNIDRKEWVKEHEASILTETQAELLRRELKREYLVEIVNADTYRV